MNFVKSPKFLIFLIVFINFLGYGIVFPILPLLTIEYGGSPLISGILIAAFSIMQVVAMPIMGRLSDRYGRKPLLLFSLWGTVISFIIMGLTHSIFWLLIARIIDGASGGNLSIAQAYIADITTKRDRASGMGVIAASLSLGFIFGPLWGGFFGNISLAAPFIAATILTAASLILTVYFLPESLSKKEVAYEKKHFHFGKFLKHITQPQLIFLFLVSLLFSWAQSGSFTTISLFGKDVLKLSVAGVSLLFAFGGILGALIQGFFVGKVLKYIHEKSLFFIASLVAALGMAIMSFGATSIIFFVGITFFSIGFSFLMPVVQALVSERSSPHEQGGNLGIMQSFGSVGRIFGPIVAGYVYQSISPFGPQTMGAIIFILIFLAGLGI